MMRPRKRTYHEFLEEFRNQFEDNSSFPTTEEEMMLYHAEMASTELLNWKYVVFLN